MPEQEEKSVSYTAVLLDKLARIEFLTRFHAFFHSHLEPVGFKVRNSVGKSYCDHLTIQLGPCRDRTLLDQEVNLTIDAWAIDDRVLALRVKDHGHVPVDNATPHVTLFVNRDRGGKPYHSNRLTNWVPLKTEIVVKGVVKEVFNP